jgi:hypothetical protein
MKVLQACDLSMAAFTTPMSAISTATNSAHILQTKFDSGFFPKALDVNNASERLI